MRTLKKMGFLSLILTLLVMMFVPTMSMAATKVELGTADSFAILAGSTVTNTGSSVVNGNLGLSPGLSVTGFPPGILNGNPYVGDAVASQAQSDLTTAYNEAAGQPVTATLAEDFGGQNLVSGVYKSLTDKFGITGILTLDGANDPNAIFIFQMGSTLTTASNSIVKLINGAQPYNVFWQVGSSATLGTSTDFKGNILAMTSITATTSANVDGRLLARNGAVTLDTNNITITRPATLHVIKHVINDNGGAAVAANFNLYVKMSGNNVISSPAAGVEAPGTTYTLVAGTYAVSEDAVAGYTGSFSGDSDASGNITLLAGDNKTITITNNDNPVQPAPPTTTGPSVQPVDNSGGQVLEIYRPLIHITKTPNTLALTSGQGPVTYTYKVTNPGTASLYNVIVTDDKVSPVNYVSGDINADNLLQSNETWIYTSTMNLYVTTTNTATATGSANDMTATDIAFVTVVVTPPIVVTPPVVITPR